MLIFTVLLSKSGNDIKRIMALFLFTSVEKGWSRILNVAVILLLFYSIFNFTYSISSPPPFFSADFGDYNQFDSQDFLREYVLFPMVSAISFFLINFLPSLVV